MSDLVADTLLWAAMAAAAVIAVGSVFVWRPWVRRKRPLHHHPAE